jgi:hypothetical protein
VAGMVVVITLGCSASFYYKTQKMDQRKVGEVEEEKRRQAEIRKKRNRRKGGRRRRKVRKEMCTRTHFFPVPYG